jgi:branched-chain amino acid transport system substrate-binding protein
MKKNFLTMTFLCFALLALTSLSTYAQAPIKIGSMNVLSGPLGVLGVDLSHVAQLAVDNVNKDGGILGRKVEIITGDDEASPTTAARLARKYILEDKVNFIIGANGTPAAMSVSEVAKRFKTIYISCAGAQGEALTGANCNKYTFRVNTSGHQFYCADALYVAETFPKLKTVAGINPDYSFGHEMWEGFIKNLKKNKPDINVVGEFWPPMAEKDYTIYITDLIEKKADLVYSVFWSGTGVAFIKQAKPYGLFDKTKFYLAGAAISTSLIYMGKDMVPIWGSEPYVFTIDNPMNKRFVTDFMSKYNIPPHGFCGQTYATIFILKQAIEKARSIDADKVIAVLEGGTFDTPWGKMTIRKGDHQAMGNVYIGQAKPDPKYPFWVLGDLKVIPGEKVSLDVSETGCHME